MSANDPFSGRPVLSLKPRPAELKPPGIPGVRIVDVGLRCVRCHAEWRGHLDAFLTIDPATTCCPRCQLQSPPPPAAA